jgi:hypothetical protein
MVGRTGMVGRSVSARGTSSLMWVWYGTKRQMVTDSDGFVAGMLSHVTTRVKIKLLGSRWDGLAVDSAVVGVIDFNVKIWVRQKTARIVR